MLETKRNNTFVGSQKAKKRKREREVEHRRAEPQAPSPFPTPLFSPLTFPSLIAVLSLLSLSILFFSDRSLPVLSLSSLPSPSLSYLLSSSSPPSLEAERIRHRVNCNCVRTSHTASSGTRPLLLHLLLRSTGNYVWRRSTRHF